MLKALTIRPTVAIAALAGFAVPAAAQCPPAPPQGLNASQGTYCGSVFLDWLDVSGANSYTIYRSEHPTYETSGFVGTALFGNSQFTDLTASLGTTYYYWVTATRTLCLPGSGTGGHSVMVSGYRGQDPDAPVSVDASDDSQCGGIRVHWGMPSFPPLGGSPQAFTVYRNTVNLYLTSTAVTTLGGLERGYLDRTAVPDTTYYYWVRAENECGTAASSSDAGSFHQSSSPPSNDLCANAITVTAGPYAGSTACALRDGTAGCGLSNQSPDVWYRFVAPTSGTLRLDTCAGGGATFDTVLSVYSGCPGITANQLACDDDGCSLGGPSIVEMPVVSGSPYLIRVSGWGADSGQFILTVTPPGGTCYANCDGSWTPPKLNVLDFSCFLQKFAAADAYANCDNSTTAPILNVQDFSCFLQKFAAGCP